MDVREKMARWLAANVDHNGEADCKRMADELLALIDGPEPTDTALHDLLGALSDEARIADARGEPARAAQILDAARRLREGERDREALEVLRELYSWVKNWDVSFLDDDEWPETQAKIIAILAAQEADDGNQ